MRPCALLVPILVLACHSCVGTTGSGVVRFKAWASGPHDADPSRPLQFDSGSGWHITLSRAKLHVGGLYLNRSVPIAGAQANSCFLPGIYVAEVTAGLDVDVLSSTPQPFGALGNGTADHASTGEVWLTGGDVNALDDPTIILDIAGVANKGGDSRTFEGRFTIGKNRFVASADATTPGANPICKQRIATPIAIDLTPRDGGDLFLEIDPRGWFDNVDFSQLKPDLASPVVYRFKDSSDPAVDPASRNLFRALHAKGGVYRFSWRNP